MNRQFALCLQHLILAFGGSLPKHGADGVWGEESDQALEALLGGSDYGGGWPENVDPVLVKWLKQDEGLRLKAYKDTVGVWTVGYGHAHVEPNTVWTEAQAEAALIEDIRKHNADLYKALPWVAGLDPVRRRVLENMSFNLGITNLLGFKNTLEHVKHGRWGQAAAGMRASLWAKQVKGRAVRLANEMETGIEQ